MRCHSISMLSVLATASGLLGSLAKPLSSRWGDMQTKHSWNTVPKNWESLGRPPFGTTIDLYIALKPYRKKALVVTLNEVSEPTHPRYGAYLSNEQVAELVAPHPETVGLVNSWLEHHGVPRSSVSMTHGGGTLTIKDVSVTKANALLGTSYELYRHVRTDEVIVRTGGYALPAVLHGHVLTVAPTTSFVSPPSQWQTPRNRSGVAAAGLTKSESGGPPMMLSSRKNFGFIAPVQVRWLYGTTAYTPAAMDQNALGVVEYGGQCPSPTDLAEFMRKYRTDAADATFSVVQVNGGQYDPKNPSTAANLDMQYAAAMAYPTPLVFYSTGLGPSGDWFFSWLAYILRRGKIPQTISTSYGIDENVYSREYATQVCDMFGLLGLRGVSVIFSSGNFGVGQDNRVTNDDPIQFEPGFPATCPYVTVVGGTTDYSPEVAAKFSGGGFSNYFERPDYQKSAVSAFFQHLGNKHKGLYNDSGRGYPDIAVQAVGFRLYSKGNLLQMSGTSGAAPNMAGIISLLNDYQISKGRAPLGFLNRLLYGRGLEGFNDIISGSNPGCNTDGFPAVVGWDPVTGLGTPDFKKLQNIVDKLP